MASILSGVSPRDPVTLAAVAVVLAIVAAVACFIPAQRVTRVAPIRVALPVTPSGEIRVRCRFR